MIATIKSALTLIGFITVLVLWKMWFPGSWASFWSMVYSMIV